MNESTRIAVANYREARRAEGLCIYCGQEPGAPKTYSTGGISTYGAICQEKVRQRGLRRGKRSYGPAHAAAVLKWAAARRDLGGCIRCARPALLRRDGRPSTRCEVHRQADKKRARNKEARRRAAGLCVACAGPSRPGKTMCAEHAKKQRGYVAKAEAAKRAAKGLAVQTPRAVVVEAPVPVPTPVPVPACPQCGINPPMTGQALCWCCVNAATKAA